MDRESCSVYEPLSAVHRRQLSFQESPRRLVRRQGEGVSVRVGRAGVVARAAAKFGDGGMGEGVACERGEALQALDFGERRW